MSERWMVCSACRKDIPYSSRYYACSVSTCNRAAMRLVFCSVSCWDSHLSILRHRDAWAVEERSPANSSAMPRQPPAPSPAATAQVRAPMTPAVPNVARPSSPAPSVPAPSVPAPSSLAPTQQTATSTAATSTSSTPLHLELADETEILIVVSKLKKYIRERSGMNTADAVADRLSVHVRAICDAAIQSAAQDNRKTVLDRDVPLPRR